MTAVLASYVKMSTLVDGTMRIVLDVEPSAAADAFSLLGSPGTSIALARIKKEAATAHDRRQQETAEQSSNHSAQGEDDRLRVSEGSRPASASPASERKPLPVAAQCALRCQEYSFQRFCRKVLADSCHWDDVQASGDELEDIARFVRAFCGVDSRSEFATNRNARERWQTLEADYLHWQREAA